MVAVSIFSHSRPKPVSWVYIKIAMGFNSNFQSPVNLSVSDAVLVVTLMMVQKLL